MNKKELVELLAKSQDAILERVDSKLQELKRSISEDQEECLSSVVKRVQEDNSIKWKKVGNEKQFKFNQSVEARFDSAISAIEKEKPDKARKELEEGKKLLSERQKLIKLAEWCECGWATVSPYVTDDLADTPEDMRLGQLFLQCPSNPQAKQVPLLHWDLGRNATCRNWKGCSRKDFTASSAPRRELETWEKEAWLDL